MILVVDSNPGILGQVSKALRSSGHEVLTAKRIEDAVFRSVEVEPALVLAGVGGSELDGFALREAYAERFPARCTPFVFLVPLLPDGAERAHQLDVAGEDYVTIPTSPTLLIAKVREIESRPPATSETVFRGDLEMLPFCSVLRYCEQKGLTGTVVVESSKLTAQVRFRAGELVVDDDDDMLGAMCDLKEGSFSIYSCPARFDDVAGIASDGTASASIQPTGSLPPASSIPASIKTAKLAGRVSTVQVGSHRLQVQTEVSGDDRSELMTLVSVEGQTVSERIVPLDANVPVDELQRKVDARHREVEEELAQRVEDARERLSSPTQSSGPHVVSPTGMSAFSSSMSPSVMEAGVAPPQAMAPARRSSLIPLIAMIAVVGIAGVTAMEVLEKLHDGTGQGATPAAEVGAAAVTAKAGPEEQNTKADLVIVVSPPEAKITLDGAELSGNPFRARVDRGSGLHKVRATADGYEPREQVVTFDHSMNTVKIELEHAQRTRRVARWPAAAAAPARTTAPSARSRSPKEGSLLRSDRRSGKPSRVIDESDPYAR